MRVVVITPPSSPVVTVDEAKDHLNVGHDDDDALIATYLNAAIETLDGPGPEGGPEGWLGRALGEQTLEMRLHGFGSEPILLSYPPIVSLTSVKYVDRDGVEQTMDAGDYELLGTELDRAYGKSWPVPRGQREAVRIQYVAGYPDGIPWRARAAILLMTGDLYAQRETFVTGTIATEVPMSTTVVDLLTPLRIWV